MNRGLLGGLVFLATMMLLLMKINFLELDEIAANGEYNDFIRSGSESDTSDTFISQYKELWYLLAGARNTWLYTLSKNISELEKTKASETYMIFRQGIENLMEYSEKPREERLKRLQDYIQKKIYGLQHPKNCGNSKLLLCDMTFQCGFGCTTYIMVNCLLTAFEARRTMVYTYPKWKYAEEGWHFAFEAVSSCTYDGSLDDIPTHSENTTDVRIVKIDRRLQEWMPFTLPEKLAPELKRLHGDPYAWWIAQFMIHVFRPRKWLQSRLQQTLKKLEDITPIVGVHVRRGDKIGKEAFSYDVEEYMYFVEQWYNGMNLDREITNRTVYLATDDSTVLPELKSKYPKYKFIVNKELKRTLETEERYNKQGLVDIITDIYTLSRSDYVVCTLTSLVCRTVYALMMQRWTDASIRIQSIDIPYRYRVSKQSYWEVVAGNDGRNRHELVAAKGDIVRVPILPWTSYREGLYTGENIRTRKYGLIPAIKLRQVYNLHRFSMFDDYKEPSRPL